MEKAKGVYLVEWLEDARREERAMHHIAMDVRQPVSSRIAAARVSTSIRAQLLEFAGVPSRPKGEREKPKREGVTDVNLEIEAAPAQLANPGTIAVDTVPELESMPLRAS